MVQVLDRSQMLNVMQQTFELNFSNNRQAKTVRLQRSSDLSSVPEQLNVAIAPTMVIVGGASGIDDATMEQLRVLFNQVLAPIAEALEAIVVDGGTDAGVMKLMGQARTAIAASFPLIGVAAVGTIILPDLPPPKDAAALEPNHTHFVLVPGALWGDEAPWIARVATALSEPHPSLTILINGGKIAWQDAANSVRTKRPVLVMEGSGRTADELAKAIRGDRSNDRAVRMVDSGLLHVANLNEGTQELTQLLKTCLKAH